MSLDIDLIPADGGGVHSQNITHNLTRMADEAGLYGPLWHPAENGITTAADLISLLERGITDMALRREHYEQFDALNGWGRYKHFLPWLQELLEACRRMPTAMVQSDI